MRQIETYAMRPIDSDADSCATNNGGELFAMMTTIILEYNLIIATQSKFETEFNGISETKMPKHRKHKLDANREYSRTWTVSN